LTLRCIIFDSLGIFIENLPKKLEDMTSEQIAIVKKSWRSLQGISPELLGDVFYSYLFLKNPSLEKMFKTSKEVQAKKLIDMLDIVVRRLDSLEELIEEIHAMAERHVEYGVKPKHYVQVGTALIWTLKTALGKDWKEDVSESWTACYQDLTQVMLES
jgi:hemoglobin-like flavoprotein